MKWFLCAWAACLLACGPMATQKWQRDITRFSTSEQFIQCNVTEGDSQKEVHKTCGDPVGVFPAKGHGHECWAYDNVGYDTRLSDITATKDTLSLDLEYQQIPFVMLCFEPQHPGEGGALIADRYQGVTSIPETSGPASLPTSFPEATREYTSQVDGNAGAGAAVAIVLGVLVIGGLAVSGQ